MTKRKHWINAERLILIKNGVDSAELA